MYIKHSKYKNTGILFEILVRKITADTLAGKESKAVKILKENFVNTEMGKEYKLYELCFKSKGASESRASTVLNTILESSKKLNRSRLKREKYNLIKELKRNYNLEDLFKTKITDYKAQASLYTLLEIYNTEKVINPNQIVDNKVTLLEHLTSKEVDKNGVKEDIITEFRRNDKDVRILTYKIILERFNDKYADLNDKQKSILKEFINSIDSTDKLKEFYNVEVTSIKKRISEEIKKTKDKAIQIKLSEVKNLLPEAGKRTRVKSEHLVDLLQYHSLLEELRKANG